VRLNLPYMIDYILLDLAVVTLAYSVYSLDSLKYFDTCLQDFFTSVSSFAATCSLELSPVHRPFTLEIGFHR